MYPATCFISDFLGISLFCILMYPASRCILELSCCITAANLKYPSTFCIQRIIPTIWCIYWCVLQVCITVNNLEHVYKYVEPLAIDFALAVDELQVKSFYV